MKKFLRKLSYTVFPLWLFWVSLTCYYNMEVLPNQQGDLGWIGRIPFKLLYERPVFNDYQNMLYEEVSNPDLLKEKYADVLVCGDSFSQLGIQGYQNYLTTSGKNVVNFAPPNVVLMNSLQTGFDLLNLNYIDSTHVRLLIVETGERCLIDRIRDFTPDHHQLQIFKETEKTAVVDRENWTLKGTNDFLLTRLGITLSHTVKQVEMDRLLYSGQYGKKLYFYDEDLKDYSIDEAHGQKLRLYMERLCQAADKNGVKVLLLICPDKYDIYQDFIVGNPYPRKSINEDVKHFLGNRPDVIIAKDILLPKIQEGEKDIYYMDDSHWSFKGARLVADYLISIMP